MNEVQRWERSLTETKGKTKLLARVILIGLILCMVLALLADVLGFMGGALTLLLLAVLAVGVIGIAREIKED